MTEAEAIKWIDDRMCYGRYTPQKHSPFIRDECCQAGELAIKALEKQIAKKPRFYAHNYHCTECGNLVGNNEFEWQRFLYCDNCGQKLDWSEV